MRSDQETELRTKLISGAKWAALVRFASQVISWGVTLAMVRLLTPQDYGLNAMIEVPLELLFLFSTLGLDVAIIHFGKRDPEQLASAFGLVLLVNISFFLVLLLSASEIAAYFREPRLTTLIQVACVVFVLVPFRVIPNALLDMALDFKLKSQVELAASIISSMVALAMAIGGAGVWALVAAILSNAILRAGLLAYFRPWVVRPALRLAPVSGLLYYGLVIMVGGAIGVIASKAVNLLAGPQLGAEILGYYAVTMVFSQLPMNKVMPILQQTMFPAFAKLKDQPVMARVYLLKSLQLSALVIFPLTIGMACVAEHLVAVVFGEKWLVIAFPLAIMAALSPLRLINQIFHGPLNAIGKAKIVSMIQVINLMILTSGALFAVDYGLMGLVSLSGFSVVVATAVSAFVGGRIFKTGLVDLTKAVWPAFSASIFMAGVLMFARFLFIEQTGLIRLVVEVVSGGGAYVFAVRIFYRSTFNEIKKHLIGG